MNMTTKNEKKLYINSDENGNKSATMITYTLWFNDDGYLIDVTNSNNVSVDKNSECWQYFDGRYNNL